MPRPERASGTILPSVDEMNLGMKRLRTEMPDLPQRDAAIEDIARIVRQTRNSWEAEIHAATKGEKVAAHALRKSLANFFKVYRGYVFAPLLDARAEIDRVLGRVLPDDDGPVMKYEGKAYRFRFGGPIPAKQRKHHCEIELWEALARHGLSEEFALVHGAAMPLCGYPSAKADSALKHIRDRRHQGRVSHPRKAPPASPEPPKVQPIGELLASMEAAPKAAKVNRSENRSAPAVRKSAPRRRR